MVGIDWQGRRVLMIGAARQGLAVTRYLIKHGATVILNDQRPLDQLTDARMALADLTDRHDRPLSWAAGGHPIELAERVDLVCVTGGAPLELPLIQYAQRIGKPITNDSQIFLQAASCLVVGITGSAGKSTTTSLMDRIANMALEVDWLTEGNRPYQKVWVGGNIGSPLIANLDLISANDLAIMELSSFQLMLMDISPQIAALLNITPNHLDRHGSMEAYTAAKRRIIEFQQPLDTAILGRDDPGAWGLRDSVRGRLLSFGIHQLPAGHEGVFLQNDEVHARWLDQFSGEWVDEFLFSTNLIRLRGVHNLQNVLAACAISIVLGLPVEAISDGVAGFSGIAHRLEFVRNWGGADWYNDSIATAPERSIAAIRSFKEPLILLAGGRDKDLPWEAFADEVLGRVDHLVVFGEAAEKILAAVHAAASRQASGSERAVTVERCKGLQEAVLAASRIIEPGDVVLLSPGGTSFDEFRDFEERGKCFVQWVTELP